MRRVVLLGPQRKVPRVREALRMLDAEGPVAVVTAGWEEREREHDELAEHLRRPVVNLGLYQRSEAIFAEDPELHRAVRRRHETLRTLQDLYRVRLDHAMDAVRRLMGRDDDPELLQPEVEDALRAVRTLDEQHLARAADVHAAFETAVTPERRPAVLRARAEVAAALAHCSALAIAGGHVLVLLNRMRLFDLPSLLGSRPLVAWSAGAMAVTERVVVFHDSPPQGRGHAEALEPGLGLVPGLVALPHAGRRLLLHDPLRVGTLARRLVPRRGVTLDDGGGATWDGRAWQLHPGTCWLSTDGAVREGALP